MKENILRTNRIYFSLFLLFLLVGAIVLFVIEKGDAIWFFSDNRSSFGDYFFRIITQAGEEPMYFLIAVYFLFKRYRHALLVGITGFVVSLLSFGLKILFSHDRPSVFFRKLGQLEDLNLVDGVHLLSGQTSFPSGHTMSGFALFTLFALLHTNKKWIAVGCFLMALLIGLSRIYLVLHFFIDIYFGAIAGVLVAITLYYLDLRYWQQPDLVINQNIYAKR